MTVHSPNPDRSPFSSFCKFRRNLPSAGKGGTELTIEWAAKAGRWYSVYSASNLSDAAWMTNLYMRQTLSDSLMSYTNTGGDASLFFRIGVENQ